MKYIDLHTHSVKSDGSFTPQEIVDYAIEKGLSAVALTDHDTVDGLDEILDYAKDKPIEVIPGIEYSTEYKGRDVHVVGLFIDYKAPAFLEYLDGFKRSRDNRNYKLCANLQKAGIDISYEALLAAYPDAVITRAHYASYLLEKGYVQSRSEAFDRYLGDKTPYFVHREKITPEEVIEVTRQAGGIPILAHPTLYGLGNEQLDILVKRLKSAGLMGIETYYSTYTPAEERKIMELAEKYRLLQSGGSDFHEKNKPGLDLGIGYGRLNVPYEVLEKQKDALHKKILFTDMDSTLLTSDKKISAGTREKLADMLKKGCSLAFASGRPLASILEVAKELGIMDEARQLHEENPEAGGVYITAHNGALAYDCINDEKLVEASVALDTAQRIFDMAGERGLHIHAYSSDERIVSIANDKELSFYMQYIHLPYVVTRDLKDVMQGDAYKLVAIDLDGRDSLEEFRKAIAASELGDEVACAFSHDSYLEIYSKSAGKGNSLVQLCRELNILLKNAAAAGDEENDISMIEAAGLGAAMSNARESVKARADYVTVNDNDHDGIVEVIEKLMNGEKYV